jgi:hypothetical protein
MNSTFNTLHNDIIRIQKINYLYELITYACVLETQMRENNFSDITVPFSSSYSNSPLSDATFNTMSSIIIRMMEDYSNYRRPFGINHLNRIKETNKILGNDIRDIYDIKCEEMINTLTRILVQLKTFFYS